MDTLIQAIRKTVLVMLVLILFIAFSTFCGIVFLAIFQWFMHTGFYLDLVGSVEFWMWVLGIPVMVIFLVFCANVA